MSKPFPTVSIADHSKTSPDVVEADGAPTWITRGSNFVIAITQAKPGTRLAVADNPDEHLVLLPDCGARITAGSETRDVAGNHLVVIPPGDGVVEAAGEGVLVRCFSARRTDLLAMAGNAGDFAEQRDGIVPLEDWPAPIGGFKLRVYDLDSHLAAGEKTRVFRCSNLMINILRERDEPRDVTALTPHHHVDFEQGSIVVRGTHVHHIRTPWVPDMTTWRADEALEVGAPSVAVIPPPLVHTTRNIGEGKALLVDLFAPPRADFSLRPGMVRNSDEYPLPTKLQEKA